MERHLRDCSVKCLIVLQKTIPAAVDLVKQSWKKEGMCFEQRSHCHWRTWALGLVHRRDVYVVEG